MCMLMILYFGELFRLETRITQELYNSSKTYAQYAGLLANGDMEESQLMKAGISGDWIFTRYRSHLKIIWVKSLMTNFL